MTKLTNTVATLTAIGSVYAVGVFCASWFPCGWSLMDLFDFVR